MKDDYTTNSHNLTYILNLDHFFILSVWRIYFLNVGVKWLCGRCRGPAFETVAVATAKADDPDTHLPQTPRSLPRALVATSGSADVKGGAGWKENGPMSGIITNDAVVPSVSRFFQEMRTATSLESLAGQK